MRVYVVALALMSAACARTGSGVLTGMDATVTNDVPTVARVARAQLQSHGYTVTTITPGILVTLPRPITAALHEAGDTAAVVGRQWILQVSATDPRFSRGTHLRVAAYIVPPGSSKASGDNIDNGKRGIPVTSANRPLFNEVRQVTRWITDAVDRIR
ncbi:MAG: hypothetical protein ABIW94_06570 [Gemmatimonadaceae bacterium]